MNTSIPTTNDSKKRKSFEYHLENCLHKSRWLLAVVYFGLIVGLAILVIAFLPYLIITFYSIFCEVPCKPPCEPLCELPFEFLNTFNLDGFIFHLLELIDIALIGNLILMVVMFGYNSFVSEIDPLKEENVKDKPSWIKEISYTKIKIKVIGSIVAISAIQLLAIFFKISKEMQVKEQAPQVKEQALQALQINGNFKWLIVLHLAFVFSGLIFAVTELILKKTDKIEYTIKQGNNTGN